MVAGLWKWWLASLKATASAAATAKTKCNDNGKDKSRSLRDDNQETSNDNGN
jgi:hypothetical protein